ncbi:MAG: AsmA family protein [Kiloniellaceae bacterium]
MKKRRGRLRRLLSFALALAVALLVAGYAIVSSLDVQQVAAFAQREVKTATGRDLLIDGPVGLSVSLTPSVDLQDVRFANAPWGSRPDMMTLKRVEIEVQLLPLLFGEVVIERLVVVAPDVLLETDADGRGNWEFQETAATAPEAPAAGGGGSEDGGRIALPDLRDVRVEGGQLALRDAASGETVTLEIVEAVGAVPAAGGTRSLSLVAAYNGNPFSLEGSYPGLPALLSGVPGLLDMTLEAGGLRLTAKGRAGDLVGARAVEVAVTAEGESLAGLSPFVGAELPALGPLKFSGDVKSERQSIELSGLRFQVGGSDLGGNATLALAGERPLLKATLLSKLLDLEDFRADGGASGGEAAGGSGGPATGGGAPGSGGRVFSDEPLPLDALRALDAEVKLDAETLRLSPALALEEARVALVLKAGDLEVAPLTARLAGGSLEGRLDLDASETRPDVALSLQGRKIDFGELLKQAEISHEVGGEMDLDVDLRGQGASPHAIASALGGHVQAVSEDGTIDNDLLKVFSAGLGDITGPLFGQADRTRLECFVARFDVTEGQARSRALVLDSGAFAVAGRGGVDLEAERVNLAFDTETSQPSLASFAVPFKLTGPLAAPRVEPDALGAAVGVVGSVGAVAESGSKVVGGAIDSVGGLIGTGPLIGQTGGSQPLCAQALAAIGRGGAAPAGSQPRGSSGGIIDDAGKALQDAGEGIEKGFKSLFGN